ncbi:Urease, partial [Coemansia brasiliensis]
MKLLPRELDKLVLNQAGLLAQRRLSRGVRLNATEATALLATVILELIRDGRHSVSDLQSIGQHILGFRHVQAAVPQSVHEVQVEGTFRDGTFLVTVHNPVCTLDGDLRLALYGSGIQIGQGADCAQDIVNPFSETLGAEARSQETQRLDEQKKINDRLFPWSDELAREFEPESEMAALGHIMPAAGAIKINQGRKRYALRVTNHGDRPVQI